MAESVDLPGRMFSAVLWGVLRFSMVVQFSEINPIQSDPHEVPIRILDFYMNRATSSS